MLPRTLLPMRAVAVAVLGSLALVAVGATSPLSAQADDVEAARAHLNELRAELDEVSDRYVEAREELIALDKAMRSRELQIRRLAEPLIKFSKLAEKLAIEMYKDGGSIDAIEGVLSAETFADMNRVSDYLEFSGEDQRKILERLERDSALIEHELDLLDEERARAQATFDELEDIRATIEANAGQVADEVDRLEDEAAAERAEELAAERAAAERAAAAATETIVENPPPPSTAPVPPPSSEADWEAIAMCESGGNWHIDSTYDGGLQFHPNTWLGYGGGRYARYAWQATKEQQIAIAEKVLVGQGPGAWPNCFQWK